MRAMAAASPATAILALMGSPPAGRSVRGIPPDPRCRAVVHEPPEVGAALPVADRHVREFGVPWPAGADGRGDRVEVPFRARGAAVVEPRLAAATRGAMGPARPV